MTDSPTADRGRRGIAFTVDGQEFKTDIRRQRAEDILRLAHLDPAMFDLGELHGDEHIRTQHFSDDEFVTVRQGSRFVSIRQAAPVA